MILMTHAHVWYVCVGSAAVNSLSCCLCVLKTDSRQNMATSTERFDKWPMSSCAFVSEKHSEQAIKKYFGPGNIAFRQPSVALMHLMLISKEPDLLFKKLRQCVHQAILQSMPLQSDERYGFRHTADAGSSNHPNCCKNMQVWTLWKYLLNSLIRSIFWPSE